MLPIFHLPVPVCAHLPQKNLCTEMAQCFLARSACPQELLAEDATPELSDTDDGTVCQK